MPEALLWRDDDGGRQQRPNKYEEYVYRSYASRPYRWKSPSKCAPKWKNQFEVGLETNSSIEERPRHNVLNTAIDKIYDELAELVACRSDQPDPSLEKQISTLFRQLRELQKQEGDLIQETVKSLASPIAAGLDVLKRADEIRAKYGSASTANSSPQNSNEAKT